MLSAKEVCQRLKVHARILAGWRTEGLPCTREKGKYLYDPDAVAAWLLATGKAQRDKTNSPQPTPIPTSPIFTKIREVAEFFGVNSRTVKVWLEDPSFPGRPGSSSDGTNAKGYFPTKSIADWLQQPGRKTKVKIPESLQKPDVVTVTPTSRDQLVEVKTEQAKLELRKMQGKMIDAEEAQSFFNRVNSYAVTVLNTLAPRLLAELPSSIDDRAKRAVYDAALKVVKQTREMIAELIEGDRDASPGGIDEHSD
jgi:phage terminase Nu1 subunit (DNA packaging protein)